MTANTDDVRPPLDRDVFAIGDQTFQWADILAAGRAWGDWQAVEESAARRAGSEADLEQTTTAFRYERGLLSADETEAWFAQWGIPVAAWLRHLRGAPSPEAEWIEGLISGTLERVAKRLAESLAVHQLRGGTEKPTTAELDEAMEEFARAAASPERLEKTIIEQRLPWTTLELGALDLPSEDAAREVLYGLREDRRSLLEIAAQAGRTPKRVRTTLEELPGELGPYFVSARPGEVLGPLAVPDGWRVVVVQSRREPSSEDPDARRRARAHVIAGAVRRERERRVRWLDPVATPR